MSNVTAREVFAPYTDELTFSQIKEMDTIAEMWTKSIQKYGDMPAVTWNGGSLTYAELECLAAAVRSFLNTTSLGESRRIGLFCQNGPDFVKAFLGVVTSGYTAVILPPQLEEKAVYGISMQCGCRLILTSSALIGKTEFAKKHIPGFAVQEIELIQEGSAPAADVDGKTPAVIMFTGGTTGQSKAVILNHTAVMQGVINGCYGYHDVFGQKYMLALPLSHVFGLIRNLLTPLYTGSDVFICDTPKDIFRDIAVFKPNVLVLVPALAELAIKLCRQFNRNMLGDSLKYVICGAAAVPPYLVREYASRGVALFPGYGLTESANLVSGNPEALKKPASVGIPYPNQELKLVNGELYIRGSNVMNGYMGLNGLDEDGWFHTGDLAKFDEEGFLYITGRVKELIVLANGENISPAEVESHFYELDEVQDCQVFEDYDDNGNRILALEVLPRGNASSDMEKFLALINRVNSSLEPSKRSVKITVRAEDFARTPSMKIVRYHKCQPNEKNC